MVEFVSARLGIWVRPSRARMMLLRSIVLTAAVLAMTTLAHSEKRVALLIGNSVYQKMSPLLNPATDAAAVMGMLKNAGFDDVESKTDLNVAEMRRVLQEFGAKTGDADVAVIYFAGRGIELDGIYYLFPVDAGPESDCSVSEQAVALDRVLMAVEPAKQLRLVILDTCRDNSFAGTTKRPPASRTVERRSASFEPTKPNTIIAFAAKAGSTGSNCHSSDNPFTAALVFHLVQPGLDLVKAFRLVRDDVLKVTHLKQEPFIYGVFGVKDVSLVPVTPAAGPAAR